MPWVADAKIAPSRVIGSVAALDSHWPMDVHVRATAGSDVDSNLAPGA